MPPLSEPGIYATFYESRRRWWGGMRADIVLEHREPIGNGIIRVLTLARKKWHPPAGWKYTTVKVA